MKISKSKQELARIISENGGWRDGNYAVQDKDDKKVWFMRALAGRPDGASFWPGVKSRGIPYSKVLTNWHQTILSRAEYSHLYPAPDADGWIEHDGKHESAVATSGLTLWCKWSDGLEQSHEANMVDWIDDSDVRVIAYRLHKPEMDKSSAVCDGETKEELDAHGWGNLGSSVARCLSASDGRINTGSFSTAKPTIEQLAADYRNAKDFAEHKQQEADAAKADADARLKALEIAGEAHGLLVTPITAKREPEMVIAVQVGDKVECIKSNVNPGKYMGRIGTVLSVDVDDTSTPYLVDFGGEAKIWCHVVKFIRRP